MAAIHGEAQGSDDIETVRRQAARSLSLDHDGRGWAEVGERDPVLGALQAQIRLAPPGLLLLRVRGGDVVRHRPADRDAPGAGRQGPAGGVVRRRRSRSAAGRSGRSRGRSACSRSPSVTGLSQVKVEQAARPRPGRDRRRPRHRTAARAARGRGARPAPGTARRRAVDRIGHPAARLRRRRRRADGRRDQPQRGGGALRPAGTA